jgi:hypothetical protein
MIRSDFRYVHRLSLQQIKQGSDMFRHQLYLSPDDGHSMLNFSKTLRLSTAIVAETVAN